MAEPQATERERAIAAERARIANRTIARLLAEQRDDGQLELGLWDTRTAA